MSAVTASTQRGSFVHPALFYRGDAEYLAGLVPFVEEGLSRQEPVAVAVPAARLAMLSGALGSASGKVRLIDMSVAGRNPGRIIPGVLRDFADRYPDRHVRIIGEPVWLGRSAKEYPACAQHEALINRSFDGRDATIVCPYDADRLSDRMLSDARATHPLVWEGEQASASGDYAPDRVVAEYNEPLRSPLDAAEFLVDKESDLPVVRRFAAGHAERMGLASDRVADLVLIVNELATNSVVHARSSARVRIWFEAADGDVVCEVHDGGFLADPLAGRRPSPPGRLGGRGLLLVNELADLVRTYTSPSGTTLHVHCHVS
ncbi:anti-sigma factor RsbA family regulatory protein [Amycolatopsis pigmentata]|uniref:Anti-sigma factor RsbA family regulatory protein n=1 Tax=Amycolatopsis pigmentata TaxID=450801 RepID=A0ABW5G234_9PSEU